MKIALCSLTALAMTLCWCSNGLAKNAKPRPPISNADSADAVFAPLRQYSVAATANNQDAAAYATVFPADGFSFLHDYAAFYWNYPLAPGTADLGADTARFAQDFGLGVDGTETLSPPTRFSLTGDRAYAVVPATDRITTDGKPVTTSGSYIVGLTRTDAGWRIAAFAWQDMPTSFGYPEADAADAAPIIAAVTSYFSGDLSAGVPAVASNGMIIDEFAPYFWRGPTAATDWLKALQKLNAGSGVADLRVALDSPDRILVKDSHAYAVIPAHLSSLTKGRPNHEDGLFIVALEKNAQGWLIDGWAWSPPRQ